jgi:hypothetical protein
MQASRVSFASDLHLRQRIGTGMGGSVRGHPAFAR